MNTKKNIRYIFLRSLSLELPRLSLFYPVLLSVGIYLQADFTIDEVYLAVIGAVLGILYVLKRYFSDGIKILLIALLGVYIGMVSYSIRLNVVEHDVLPYKTTAHVTGTVVSSLHSQKKSQIVLKNVIIDNRTFNGLVRLNVSSTVNVGAIIQVKSILYPPAKPVIAGAFDFRRYAYFKGIGAFGKSLSPIHIIKPSQKSFSNLLTNTLYKKLPEESASLATALVTANRLGISKENTAALRGAGLAHLLAISGLHIGLVMGVIYFIIRFGGVAILGNKTTTYSLKKIASIISLIVGFLYGALAGFPIPTIRAFLMASLIVVGVLSHRRVITMRSVALVASFILLFQPESIFSPSFQLSFSAVVGLVGVYEMGRFSKKGISGFFYGVFISSAVAMLATTPFGIYHFGTVGLYGVLANMIAIPLMGFVIVPSLMVGLVESLTLGTSLFLQIGGNGIDILLAWAHMIYALPNSVLTFAGGSGSALSIFSLGVYSFFVLRYVWRYVALGVGIVALVFLFIATSPPIGYVLKNGAVVLFKNDRYVLSGYKNSYAMRAIKHQTGEDVEKGVLCKSNACKQGKILVVLGDNLPKKVCSSDNNDTRLIIAPKIFIKNCSTPSIDKMDLYLNGGYSINKDWKINIVEPTGKPWE